MPKIWTPLSCRNRNELLLACMYVLMALKCTLPPQLPNHCPLPPPFYLPLIPPPPPPHTNTTLNVLIHWSESSLRKLFSLQHVLQAIQSCSLCSASHSVLVSLFCKSFSGGGAGEGIRDKADWCSVLIMSFCTSLSLAGPTVFHARCHCLQPWQSVLSLFQEQTNLTCTRYTVNLTMWCSASKTLHFSELMHLRHARRKHSKTCLKGPLPVRPTLKPFQRQHREFQWHGVKRIILWAFPSAYKPSELNWTSFAGSL